MTVYGVKTISKRATMAAENPDGNRKYTGSRYKIDTPEGGRSGTDRKDEDEEARRRDDGMVVIGCFPSDAVQKACTTVASETDQGLLATWLWGRCQGSGPLRLVLTVRKAAAK